MFLHGRPVHCPARVQKRRCIDRGANTDVVIGAGIRWRHTPVLTALYALPPAGGTNTGNVPNVAIGTVISIRPLQTMYLMSPLVLSSVSDLYRQCT